jgi:hypothetical protein
MTADAATFSRTDLTRKTREILELVRRGRPAVIQSYGEEQAVLVDPLDYRLLQGLAGLASGRVEERDGEIGVLLGRYLSNEISLSKVASELGVSRFDLMERFERLGVPIEVGPDSLEDARAEVEASRVLGK